MILTEDDERDLRRIINDVLSVRVDEVVLSTRRLVALAEAAEARRVAEEAKAPTWGEAGGPTP